MHFVYSRLTCYGKAIAGAQCLRVPAPAGRSRQSPSSGHGSGTGRFFPVPLSAATQLTVRAPRPAEPQAPGAALAETPLSVLWLRHRGRAHLSQRPRVRHGARPRPRLGAGVRGKAGSARGASEVDRWEGNLRLVEKDPRRPQTLRNTPERGSLGDGSIPNASPGPPCIRSGVQRFLGPVPLCLQRLFAFLQGRRVWKRQGRGIKCF